MFSIVLFSCSASIENDAGDEVFVVEIENDEEMIECEEGAPPCDVLSSWVYDAYDSNEYQEVVNEAKHAIACNCAVTHADQIYTFLARAYVELDQDAKATKSIEKGLSYSPENMEWLMMIQKLSGGNTDNDKFKNTENIKKSMSHILGIREAIEN